MGPKSRRPQFEQRLQFPLTVMYRLATLRPFSRATAR